MERLILEDDWEKIEKLYENEWFGEQELEVFLKLAEEWRRPAALMGLLHLKKEKYGFKEKKLNCEQPGENVYQMYFGTYRLQNVNAIKRYQEHGWKGIKLVGQKERGRSVNRSRKNWDTYPGKRKERTVLLFSISGRCFCLHFRERLGRDQNHRNRWRILPFFTGISAGALCEKGRRQCEEVIAHAAALPVSAPFPGKSGGQTLMEPGL